MRDPRQRAVSAATVAMALILVIGGVAGIAMHGRKSTKPQIARATATATHPAATPTPTPVPLPAGNDWTQYRFDIAGTGVNPETSITSANIGHLAQRWAQSQIARFHPFESTPAELDGIIYVTAGHSLHALDLLTGQELWRFDDLAQEPGTLSSSVAIDRDTHIAYYGSADARIYAINTNTRHMVWNVQLGDPNQGAYVWSSPLILNGVVYVGLASHEDNPCVRGALFALNAATGATIWVHYVVPAGTIGGGVWSSPTVDLAAHQILVTTSNPCPGNNVAGEEDSILGLNWDTGATVWQYQALTYDACDCDFGEGPVVFTYQGTKYVVAGNKYGTVYAVVPPANGGTARLAWSLQIAPSGYLGQGGIFEPPTYINGVIYVAGGPTLDGACQQGALWALKADTGASLWRQCTAGQVVGPSAVVGDLLFVGQQSTIVAYALSSGNVVWRAAQNGPVWGGVSVARGFVLIGTVAGTFYCYALPPGTS